jgi:hypothetical protein
MRAVRSSIIVTLFILPTLALPATLPAQAASGRYGALIGYATLTPQVADPVGAFAAYVGTGWGMNGSFLWPLPHVPWLSVRGDLGFVRYGDTNRQVCVVYNTLPVPSDGPACATGRALVTSSTIVHGGLGPQLTVPLGPVRAYANGAVQLRYFGASSSLVRNDGVRAFHERFGQADAAWSAGYGVVFALPIRGARVNIDLGVQRYHDGSVRYLRASDIVLAAYVDGLPLPKGWQPPAGSIYVGNGAYVMVNPPQRSPMDLVVYHIGVRMAVP